MHNDETDTVAHLRQPPYSAEAEQSVLGALLQDVRVLAQVSDKLTPASFFSSAHQLIYAAICSIAKDGGACDVVTVHQALQATDTHNEVDGLAYLDALEKCVPNAANAKRYAEIVAERYASRQLIAALDTATAAAWNSALPLDERLSRAAEQLRRAEKAHTSPGAARVPLLALDALQQHAQAVQWLCKYVIPANSVGMLFGGSGTFKSYIALDLALHVCHGLPWMGRKTRKGPVIFIAAEGGAGLWKRIEAWHRVRRLDYRKAQLFVVPMAVDLATDAWRVVDAAQLAGVTPELVVVDTLSQTYSGEENSANEMAAYLREIGLRFRALWQAAVLLVHHSGHAATERPRGSSAIRANLDFLLGVFRDEKEMLATLTALKQKDGELFDDVTFQLIKVDLGEDEDGDRLTQLAARHLSSAEEVQEAAEAEVKAGRGGRNQLLLSLLQNGMKERELRTLFMEASGDLSEDARRQAYSRASTWAKKSGFYEVAQGFVLTLKQRG